jgi:PKD repeat protein
MKTLSKLVVAPAFKIRIIFYLLQISACDLPVVEPINPNPTSKFVYAVQSASCTADCSVSFTNQSVNAESYEWNFGDGTPVSNTLNPVHTYALPGTYNVSLKAMNDVAEHDTTISVVLESGSTGAEPTACFTISNDNCTAPCTVTFTNCSGNATSWEWNFGDGSAVATTENATHLFATPGLFEVSLKASNGSGSHTVTETVSIAATPELIAIRHNANVSNISAQVTRIDNELTNNNPGKILVVTPVLGAYNDAALGVWYHANQWYVFNQDLSSIVDGEKFNIVVSDPHDSYAFVHRTSPANIRDGYISTIDHPSTNNNPTARIFVTPVWEKASDYNIHPVGVVYVNNRWEIFNLSTAPLPSDLKFNVIVSTNDQQSFLHSSTSTSVVSNYTVIDDPRTNTKSELKVLVTLNQGTSIGPIINAIPTGVWYSPSHGMWTVFNEHISAMPQGVRYNILAID